MIVSTGSTAGILFAQTPAGLVPSSANIYLSSSVVSKFVKSTKYMVDKLGTKKQKNNFRKFIVNLKNNTGINILSDFSLRKSGVDVNRTVGFASYQDNAQGGERFLILLPVFDEAISPFKLVELLKGVSRNKKIDLNPIITPYHGRAIFQIRGDIFLTSLNGYLVIGSTGEIIRKVIDVEMGNGNSLLYDKDYVDSNINLSQRGDLNGFIRVEYLKKKFRSEAGNFLNLINDTKFYGCTVAIDTVLEKISIVASVKFLSNDRISMFSNANIKSSKIYKHENINAYVVFNKNNKSNSNKNILKNYKLIKKSKTTKKLRNTIGKKVFLYVLLKSGDKVLKEYDDYGKISRVVKLLVLKGIKEKNQLIFNVDMDLHKDKQIKKNRVKKIGV